MSESPRSPSATPPTTPEEIKAFYAANPQPVRSRSSPVPRESRSEIKRRVTMQGGTMDEAFEEIKRVESSRGTEPEDFEKMLGRLIYLHNQTWLIEKGYTNLTERIQHKRDLADASAAIRGYVSRLQSENEKLQREIKAASKMFGEVCEPLHDCCQKYKLGLGGEHVQRLVVEEVDRLHSELSRIQQTGLTPDEAGEIVHCFEHIFKHTPEEGCDCLKCSFIPKLRSLAALRSLEGDRGK